MKLSDEDNEKIASQYRKHRLKGISLFLPIPLVDAFQKEAELVEQALEDEANGRSAPAKLKHTCEFRPKLDSDSSRSWTVIPRQAGH